VCCMQHVHMQHTQLNADAVHAACCVAAGGGPAALLLLG
jgi:hypothetical protein